MLVAETDCLTCNVHCFIQEHSNKEWLQKVNEGKKILKRRSGQAIIYFGTPITSLLFINDGKVKVVADGLFGKQQIKRLAKAGDIIGFREMDGTHISPSSVYAIDDSVICSVEREFFIDLLKANPDMMLETIMLLTKELRKSEWRMKSLMLMNAREKISYSLLYINEVFGKCSGGELAVKLTRLEIGEIACTSREEVSRTLSDFEHEGIIKTEGKRIFLVNLPELKNMIGINEDVSFT